MIMNDKLRFKLSPISLALIAIFGSGAVGATELPAKLKADLAAMPGITVQPDGGVKVGSTIYIPLLPANYNAATTNVGLSDLKPQADGSFVSGNIQFAPITTTPGSLPQLPLNFTPLSGNTLPSNFKPPAGFVPSANTPLPTGVTVPLKTPADLVKDLETAGSLPKGSVTFNLDGSVTSGGQTYMPFAPSADKQGKFDSKSGIKPGIEGSANGVFTFPDGTQMVPIIAGSTAGSQTLPPDFKATAGTSLPKDVKLPPQFNIPSNMQLPPGMTLPAGVVIPNDYKFMIPPGTILPAGVTIPTGVQLASDIVIPPGLMMPPGTNVSTANLPVGTVFLPNGSIVVPGLSIPAGMTPPTGWVPPSGVVKNAGGGYNVALPPAGGYPTPPPPNMINADGSMLMADGTKFQPPPFIGQVGAGGVLSTTGFTMPTNFTSVVAAGFVIPATQAATLDMKTGQINIPIGGLAPAGAITNANGSFTMPPPQHFPRINHGCWRQL